MRQRSVRIKRFEEQFPEALDLLSRAIRAGHAFQTAMGMVADELSEPVGPEFKKTFEQQNFGLPLRDALDAMSVRIPIIDVRFFVTAVLIQRETGGNLSEILDNLAHVVRERFKVLRQVRVHTAHGRFTGYVLLALPAALAVALSLHQSRPHEPAVSRSDGANDAHGRGRDADDRVFLDQARHQDRGVACSSSCRCSRSRSARCSSRPARWRFASGHAATIERRLGDLTGTRVRTRREAPGYDRIVDTFKRLGHAVPQSTSEMGRLRTKLVQRGLSRT